MTGTVDRVQRVQRILRDLMITFVGAFILVYETVWAKEPNWELIGAALTCFGLPPALRVDLRRKGDTEGGGQG